MIGVSEGAKTSIFLAADPKVDLVSGVYFFECEPQETTPISYDENEWKKLWEHSLLWTGVKATV